MGFNPGGGNISGATDVALNNPATTDYLGYNGTLGKWVNRVPSFEAAGAVANAKSSAIGVAIYNGSTYPARPSGYGTVQWIGPVTPTNGIDGDLWINTA